MTSPGGSRPSDLAQFKRAHEQQGNSGPITLASLPVVLGKHIVRHVVLLKFKDGVNRDVAARAISEELSKLPPQIVYGTRGDSVFLALTLGADIGLDPVERNHDYALVADFVDQAGYDVYAKHPAHQAAIASAIKPVLAPNGRVAVQFAIPDPRYK